MMNCPNCSNNLIHGGDHDDEDADGRGYIASNLSCPECDTFLIIYTPIEEPHGTSS